MCFTNLLINLLESEDERGMMKGLTHRGSTGLWGLALLMGKNLAVSVAATVGLP